MKKIVLFCFLILISGCAFNKKCPPCTGLCYKGYRILLTSDEAYIRGWNEGFSSGIKKADGIPMGEIQK